MRMSLGRRHEVHGMAQMIRMQLDEITTETLEVTELATGLFRLESSPIGAPQPLYRGDTVEVVPVNPGTVRKVRVVERAPFSHQSWVVTRLFPGSREYVKFVQDVEAAGGSVENALGGVLRAHLPVNSSFDADAELDRALGEHARRSEPLWSRVRRWLTGRQYQRPGWPAA